MSQACSAGIVMTVSVAVGMLKAGVIRHDRLAYIGVLLWVRYVGTSDSGCRNKAIVPIQTSLQHVTP